MAVLERHAHCPSRSMKILGAINHFLIGLKAHSTRGNPFLALQEDQKPVARYIIGPMKELFCLHSVIRVSQHSACIPAKTLSSLPVKFCCQCLLILFLHITYLRSFLHTSAIASYPKSYILLAGLQQPHFWVLDSCWLDSIIFKSS